MRLVRVQQSGNVNVEVDSTDSVDLSKVLEEMREQYEAVMAKNKLELEKWFKAKVRRERTFENTENKNFDEKVDETDGDVTGFIAYKHVCVCVCVRACVCVCVRVCKKVDNLQSQISSKTTEVKTSSSELSELKRTYQSLEISRSSAVASVSLRGNDRMQYIHVYFKIQVFNM